MIRNLSLFAAFFLACSVTLADDGAADATFKITTKKNDDAVAVRVDDGKTVFVIKSPSGISQAVIERQGDKWPDAVTLRLQLNGLESFQASNSKVSLNAAVSNQNGTLTVRSWKDANEASPLDQKSPFWIATRIVGGDGKPATRLPLKGGYFEMTLPKAFFEGQPKTITVKWVDFHRG